MNDARYRRSLWRVASAIILFNGLLAAWLLLKPVDHAVVVAVDNVAQFLGPLLVLPLCFAPIPAARGGRAAGIARRWVPILLGLSILSEVIGQIIFTYYEQILKEPAPFPSWADVGYLSLYPSLSLAILLLPARPIPAAGRLRILLDGFMIMVAAVTVSWYIILGPTMMQGEQTLFGKAVSAAYPLWDLVLIVCLLLLASRAVDTAVRPVVRLLGLALSIIVAADSVLDIQNLHNAYATGELLDVGWPLGFMLVGLAAMAMRRALAAPIEASLRDEAASEPLWRLILPFALVPIIVALMAYAWHTRSDDAATIGVYVGGLTLIGLLLLRQILTILENHALYRGLGTAYMRQSQDLAQRVVELELLVESADALNSTLDRDRILRTLAERLATALDAANAAFTHVDRASRRCKSLVSYAVAGVAPQFAEDPWEPLDDYPELEAVLNTARPFYGYVDDPAFPAEERAYLQRHGFRAELLVPLMLRGESIGVLEIHWTRTIRIEQEIIALCTAIAAQGAIALDNARLFADATTRAERDALTNLPNRTLFHDRLGQALRQALRDNTSFALLLLDLDRFKEINDTLGHHYGDILLQLVASRLQSLVRDSDTVARLGGDEFAVLLPLTDRDGAAILAGTLLAALTEPLMVEEHALDVDASIGIALYPDHGADAATLLRRADIAMYEAKRTRTGYVVYDGAQDRTSPHRLALMSELRQAIEDDRLLLYYQPLVRLDDKAVAGVEALLRWPHPERGFITPDQFIPLAEHTGLIAPLTDWVLRRALGQCRDWHSAGRQLGIHVNLSMRTIHDARLPEHVAALLCEYAIAPHYLTLEITESALMSDPARALDVLTRLAALGVHIAIDDFGTGYSSLGYLKELPVSEVKIDKSFVLAMDRNVKDAAIVRSVVVMAHALNLQVVAEGVESEVVWTLLRAMQSDAAQGYHLSRPLAPAELMEWLSAVPTPTQDIA